MKAITETLMIVCDKKHPHFGFTGYLTGDVISVCLRPMAKVKSESCKHMGDGFYVEQGQIRAVEKTRLSTPVNCTCGTESVYCPFHKKRLHTEEPHV